ncbi:hypothetical protein [Latilactobacillus curvatus]|uniref:hypothetical protein n=1 Tax=Latilactobacillus curvatus TaxID=28038 RepID=UPI0028B68A7A|nr:hypothetical protein [Latilactobacillus curvatus]MDT7016188.1 hypothetical protein [Latilactobacillus curvatus]
MEFYHSTTEEARDAILKNNKIQITHYNMVNYIDAVLPELKAGGKIKLPSSIRGMRSVPYLGEGIYCFDDLEGADEYTPEHDAVVKIECTDKEILNLDATDFLEKLFYFLKFEFDEFLESKWFSDETKAEYKVLKKQAINYVLDLDDGDAEEIPEMNAVFLFLIFDLQQKRCPDIVVKKFEEFEYPYFAIKNEKIIEKVS